MSQYQMLVLGHGTMQIIPEIRARERLASGTFLKFSLAAALLLQLLRLIRHILRKLHFALTVEQAHKSLKLRFTMSSVNCKAGAIKLAFDSLEG